MIKNLPAKAGDTRDQVSSLDSEDGVRSGNPL